MGELLDSKLIREMPNGTVIVHNGPMLMSIVVSKDRKLNKTLAIQGAKKALEVLETLARFRRIITQKIGEVVLVDDLPPLVKRMVLAARSFDDPTITPLIAVAGAGADEVADFVFNTEEPSKVIINNGGDIAIRLREPEVVQIGIKTDLTNKAVTHILSVSAKDGIGGVATSGFGGRSLTRGIANAAVAVAEDACLADVAATLIGNVTNIQSPNVTKALAKQLYESTDIPDLWVTTSVGHLERWEIEEALGRGIQNALAFEEKGLIIGAFLAVKDQYGISKSILQCVGLVSDLVSA